MNPTALAMKLLTYTAAAALLGLAFLTFSLTLGHESIGAFATLVATLLVLSFIRDYAPRQSRWEPSRAATTAHFPTRAHVICRRALSTRLAA